MADKPNIRRTTRLAAALELQRLTDAVSSGDLEQVNFNWSASGTVMSYASSELIAKDYRTPQTEEYKLHQEEYKHHIEYEKTESELLRDEALWAEVACGVFDVVHKTYWPTVPMQPWYRLEKAWRDAWIAGVKVAVERHQILFAEPEEKH